MGYAAGERLQVDARRRWPIYVFPDLIGLSDGSTPCRLPARPQRRPAERRRSSSPQQGQGEQKSGATDRLRRRRGRRETRRERSIAFGGRGERESANDSDRGGESDGERQLPAPDDEQDNAKEDVVVHSLYPGSGIDSLRPVGPSMGWRLRSSMDAAAPGPDRRSGFRASRMRRRHGHTRLRSWASIAGPTSRSRRGRAGRACSTTDPRRGRSLSVDLPPHRGERSG